MDSIRVRFDYFYEEESEQFAFYRIPKALFTEEIFCTLSTDAKLLYGLMLDRMTLSRRNQWFDEEGRVYIVFTVEEISDYLNCGKEKSIKILSELDEDKGIGLIQRVRTGFGRPTQIYVKNFVAKVGVRRAGISFEEAISRKNRPREVGKTDHDRSENQTTISRKNRPREVGKSDHDKSENQITMSRKNRPREVGKTDPINNDVSNTNSSETNSINPSRSGGWKEWECVIKENIGYEYIVFDRPESEELVDEMVEIIVEILAFSKDSVIVGDVEYPYEFVKEKLLRLTQSHILYVLSGLKTAMPKMANPKSYLLKCLMNAPMTINSYYQTRVLHDMKTGVLCDTVTQS